MQQRADEQRQQYDHRVGLGGHCHAAKRRIHKSEPDAPRVRIARKTEHRARAQQNHQVNVVDELREQ